MTTKLWSGAQVTEAMHDKTNLHNFEAEEAVLGSVLINPDALIDVLPVVKPNDFYIVRHGWIYETLLSLHERREPIDYVTVVDDLERQGRLEEARPLLERALRLLEEAGDRAEIAKTRGLLASLAQSLGHLSPLAVLERGYAIVRSGPEPEAPVIRRARDARAGQRLHVKLSEGELSVRVAPRGARPEAPDAQRTLFDTTDPKEEP